jgi:hypothetical protein
MCLLAALSLNIFHPGYFFEAPETIDLSEQSLKPASREKTRGYSMMMDDTPFSPFDLKPPQPMFVGNVTCVRCACRDDRRSWI